jgi:hypothetical protein
VPTRSPWGFEKEEEGRRNKVKRSQVKERFTGGRRGNLSDTKLFQHVRHLLGTNKELSIVAAVHLLCVRHVGNELNLRKNVH